MEVAFLLQKIAEEMGIVFHHEEITVEENRQRNEYLRRYYNPKTGEGSDTGDRRILRLPDAPIPVQYIPKALFENEMMAQRLVECGSLAGYAERYGHDIRIATDEAGRNPQLADGGDATEELWRECRVTIGSAESQESVRGIDSAGDREQHARNRARR